MEAPYVARVSCPGQFCMLKVPGVFLRRPLSIFAAHGSRVEFLYRVAGAGTENLSRLKAGDELEVLGPLGNGYPLSKLSKDSMPLLVAGGTGIASLHFLASRLTLPGILFFGGKSRKDLVAVDSFRKKGWKIHLATEDGSQGLKGYVTEACKYYLAYGPCAHAVIFACGPHAMLARVGEIAGEKGATGYVSLEEKMACGMGNCQGCAVKIGGTHKMVCKDGPVFKMDEVFF